MTSTSGTSDGSADAGAALSMGSPPPSGEPELEHDANSTANTDRRTHSIMAADQPKLIISRLLIGLGAGRFAA